MLLSHKDGFQAYDQWKKHWNGTSQQQGNLKMFMAERILPYWVKCCDCGKWRQYPITEGDLTTDVVESWTCRSYKKLKKVMSKTVNFHFVYCSRMYWYTKKFIIEKQ